MIEKPIRRYDLDWLRILVILILVPYHAAWMMAFVPEFSQIPREGFGFTLMRVGVAFPYLWGMPLLFFISGAGTCLALGYRSPGDYIRERLLRLLVPLLAFMVFGAPLIAYFWPDMAAGRSLADYFTHFWPTGLQALYGNGVALPKWWHLWFVAYLLCFSFLALPLFLFLREPVARAWVARLATVLDKKGFIFLAGLPLAMAWGILSLKWPAASPKNASWTYFGYHLLLFLYGFLFCLEGKFQQIMARYLIPALLLGTGTAVGTVAMMAHMPEHLMHTNIGYLAIFSGLRGLSTWCWIVVLLGVAGQFLTTRNRFLEYFNRASYPFYILHLILMSIVEYYVTQWNNGLMAEFLIFSIV
ncbi:MAG: acyltransferase family protein, partial [Gammaproteobacteria bacterium]|nr:acyltransferase family protein [Gammaproteobacteria bacterium]